MSNTNVIPYAFNDNQLRVVQIDGQPWFLASDACHCLGIRNHGTLYERLNLDERGYIGRTDVGLPAGRPMVVVSESGLYKLIMRSDKAEARVFQDWVTRDVLPAIRKDGMYIQGEEKVVTGELEVEDLIRQASERVMAKVHRLEQEKY
ncbi:Bro-N domain-containing protein [Sedimenticola selenatireducens]|uniref:BRO family protein n=1 Tax=Sedimenticola selenatireducens TaxID=191960 RepID=A0A2N6CR96_9GAMM|nr:BRO family protein [Sedimenticola selenatireducens]PLX59586.1 MAG: BRO family protein [Sedimenticola selenatireducens]